MTTIFAKLKPLLYLAVGFFAALGVLSVTQGHPAQASTSPGVNLNALLTQFYALQATVASQASTISALQAKTAPLGVSGTNLTISGVNVHIVDGTGKTSSTSGLGNLIIGYNATGNRNGDTRTGSHNLILGDENNYSSYGGLVVGYANTISGEYASVSGGQINTASGPNASVSGGGGNTASGPSASISGGGGNNAVGGNASVSGGQSNSANGPATAVSGGQSITQNSPNGWSGGPLSGGGTTLTITGVNVNLIDGTGSTNSTSGLGNLTIGYNALRGSSGDTRTGSHNLILGDQNSYSSYGGLVAGTFNTISGIYASVSGGSINTASGIYASVSGGGGNTASGTETSISGGQGNNAGGNSASVSGGFALTQDNFQGWAAGNYHSP